MREIDAMGGVMGKVADATAIQFHRLGTKKGPAVRSRRCQSDMDAYSRMMRYLVEQEPNIRLRQDRIERLLATDEMLVKRPILVGDGLLLVGFKEAEWEAAL